MKLYRNAVILVVVLGLLVGAYAFINYKKSKASDSTQTSPTDNSLYVCQLDKDKVTELAMKGKAGEFTLVKNDKTWKLSPDDGLKILSDQADSLVSTAATILADKVVDQNASNMSTYGLDNPGNTVAIKTSDGKSTTVDIGSDVPVQNGGAYARVEGSNKVYVIGPYTVQQLREDVSAIMDKTIFAYKNEDVTGVSMDRDGSNIFTAKLVNKDSADWELSAPASLKGDATKIGTIIDGSIKSNIVSLGELKPADLSKYGLQTPRYGIELSTAAGSTKLLLGSEKTKDKEIYAKLANQDMVFTVDESALTFLDKPLEDVLDPFVFIPNINDVDRVVLQIDGQTYDCTIKTDANDKDKDKFTVNGKDATMKDKDDNQPFRKFYQGVIGVTFNHIEIGAVPSGTPDITITYYMKKDPKVVKVDFITKDNETYYAVKNGVYTNMNVLKSKFDEKDGVRDTLKQLMDALNKK